MKLRLERLLPCDPEIAFSLATDPVRMCLWSTAPVRSTRPGDGGHPAGVGALREVRLEGRRPRVLEEVIETSDPPERFVYRVIRGAPVRDHRGEMTFTASPGGTRFVWEVEAEMMLPGLGAIARRALMPALHESVDQLARAARSAQPAPLPPRRSFPDDRDTVTALLADAETIREEQRALADELEAAGEKLHWFTRVYEYVTEAQVAACRDGAFDHPAWVLHLVPRFHHYYAFNLRRVLHREAGPMEEHWRHAFDATIRPERWRRGRFEGMGWAVFQGMRAHIEEDLPRALAEVYFEHFRHRCDYARFRADYLRMGFIFQRAGDRLMTHLRPLEVPLRTRLLTGLLPREITDAWTAKSFYDIPRKRREAFERGERLVTLLGGAAA